MLFENFDAQESSSFSDGGISEIEVEIEGEGGGEIEITGVVVVVDDDDDDGIVVSILSEGSTFGERGKESN